MARTYAYALSGGLLATFTVSPALAALLLPEKVSETETWAVRGLRSFYEPVRDFVLARRRLTLVAGLGVGALAILAGSTIGLEFLPKLEEGNMWIRAVMPASISLEAGNDYANRMRKLIKSFPEAETVISQHGRPDDGTDSTGFFNAEFFVPLKPIRPMAQGNRQGEAHRRDERRPGEGLPRRRVHLLPVHPGQRRGGGVGREGRELRQGLRSRSRDLAKVANDIKNAIATVPGITDLAVFGLARPADHPDRHRPRQGRPLRSRSRRHQRNGAGRDRWPGGGRPLRERQRPAFSR